MKPGNTASLRRRKKYTALALVFILAVLTLYGFSRLPGFQYLRGKKGNERVYDLNALDEMPEEKRRETIQEWVREWEGLPEEEKAVRADQFLDAVIDDVADELDMDRRQRIETRSIVKGVALLGKEIAPEPGQRPDEEQRQMLQQLADQVRSQLERILTEEQRKELEILAEQRRERREKWRREMQEREEE